MDRKFLKSGSELQRYLLVQLLSIFSSSIKTFDDLQFFLSVTLPKHLPYPIAHTENATKFCNSLHMLKNEYFVLVLNKYGVLYPILHCPWNQDMRINVFHNILMMCQIDGIKEV